MVHLAQFLLFYASCPASNKKITRHVKKKRKEKKRKEKKRKEKKENEGRKEERKNRCLPISGRSLCCVFLFVINALVSGMRSIQGSGVN